MMRAVLLIALAAPAATALPALAAEQPRPMFSAADAADATAVVHRYFAAFTAKDCGTMRAVFNAPYLMGGRELTALPDLDAVLQRYQAIRGPLDQADYSASKAVEVRITPLHAGSALANVHWRRLKKDGGLLNEGAEMMLVAKVDGQWKITGVLPEDLRQYQKAKAP
jgi:hypothetical protein